MRGHTVKTPANVAIARVMYEQQGYLQRQIADHFGVKVQTIHEWLKDPDGTAMRARKNSYAQSCVDCGAPTSGSEGRRDEPRCYPCANALAVAGRTIWTREAVVLAMQEWAAEYGEPPGAADWNPRLAERKLNDPERAARFRGADGRWPWTTNVYAAWGSWNAAMRAAGFTPRAPVSTSESYKRRRDMRAKATA